MLKNAFLAVKPSYQLILKDKVSFILALIPILIGMTLYYFVGKNIFTSLMSYGQQYISGYVTNETLGSAINIVVGSILSILLYFIVNWTFVLIVSVIASPFNDVLSARLEKKYLGQDLPSLNESIKSTFTNVVQTIISELKKISFILVLSILAVLLGLFPLLTPISILIGSIVLSTEFLDFSWGRHGMKFKEIKAEIKRNFISYSLGGSFFMLLVSIPFINLLVPSWGTSYFTILWVKNNESSN
jgi:CysZ protein